MKNDQFDSLPSKTVIRKGETSGIFLSGSGKQELADTD